LLSLSLNVLCSLNFFLFFYFIFLTSALTYAIPSLKSLNKNSFFKYSWNNFEYNTGFDVFSITLIPFLLYFFFLYSWTMPASSAWFGNLILSSLQIKLFYFYFIIIFFIINIFSNFFYLNSREIYDFILVILNFFFFIFFLFLSNNFFTLIFIIELTSTLIFLMFVTSTFSSNYFYNNLNINLYAYFNNSSPLFFIQSIVFFFWMSLLASLNLFLSLTFFYFKFFTFEWSLIENIFFFLSTTSVFKDILFMNFIWYNFLFCLFLKCGLVPFYYWKPTFFKGIPFHFLFIYIILFYFFLMIFILILLLFYFSEIFFYFILSNTLMTLVGFAFFFFILTESFYLKSFLAMSSILNTIFIFLVINATIIDDFFF